MHEHKQEPCWDAHCAPHLTHHDAGVRELIARAEARGAERVAEELTEAIRFTVEYVGTRTLPPIEGWSWYDALRKYAPEKADALLAEHRNLAVEVSPDCTCGPTAPYSSHEWDCPRNPQNERPAPEPPSNVTEDDVARVLYDNSGESYAECEDAARAILATFHVTRRGTTR